MTTHKSNQNTGLCNSQVDHDDTPRSVSQHISNNVRSRFDTPERRKRASEHADSSRSEQKYSREIGLPASDTLSTDSSEDDTTNKTNGSQHSNIEETFETHQHKTMRKKPNPMIKKLIFSEESRSVVIKCNERYSS